MPNNIEKVEFSFGWLALKLLGKSLYSNTWSALSELVANGFDAKAKKVYVYINMVNKSDATIEIFDNGTGMNTQSLNTYVKVGSNNRPLNPSADGYLTMGRKGIGKLAALYLSSNYYIITKTEEQNTKWKMVYQENEDRQEEHPYLSIANEDINIFSKKEWEECKTGTLIQMKNVDLRGLGDKAYDSLHIKLSNIFALDALEDRHILLFVQGRPEEKILFEEVKKGIAFKNMAFIDYNFDGHSSSITKEITDNKENIIKFPLNKLNGQQFYQHKCELKEFQSIEKINISGTYDYIKDPQKPEEKISRQYNLTGWIGLHASIDNDQAKINDERFTKNKFYNPIQLRLYVRNKLAVENFLSFIDNTQAFVNYIEGEIHFDILDDDDLPDIATSNRQSLNENDKRVLLLKASVGKITNNLITARANLAKKIKEEEASLEKKQKTTAKKQFAKEIEGELSSFTGLSADDKISITERVTSKLEGEVTPKSDYIVFFSHTSADKLFTDFLYNLLKHKGAKKEEFFYTSAEDSAYKYENISSLGTQIKDNIINKNAYILYMTSKDYKKNEYCMFEGGAGWATRSVGEYLLLSTTYKEIPKFLTNGKVEFCLENNKTITLGRKEYLFFISILNKMIEHINAGRTAKNEPLLCKFAEEEIPDDVILNGQGKTMIDYMDKDVLSYWDTYVEKQIEEYLKGRYKEVVAV